MTDIAIPRLHPGQRRIWTRSARFNPIRCGRRWGKTKFGIVRLMIPPGAPEGIVAPSPRAWFAPTYKLLAEVWREANERLKPAIASKSTQDKTILLHDGTRLDFWTLEDNDAGRSRKYRHVVIDEAAMVRNLKDAWELSIRPTLTDYRGTADFLSTPKGRNFFASLCDRGTWIRDVDGRQVVCEPGDPGARPLLAKADGSPEFPDFRAFHSPSSENPHLPPGEVDDARRELPDLVFKQEYLGEFVDFAGTVVKREWLRWGDPLERWTEEQLVTCAGCDLAVKFSDTSDYTAIVVLSRDPDGYYWVRWAERGRLPFRDQLALIAHTASRFRCRATYVEEVAYQAVAVQELLQTTSLAIFGFKPDKDKFTRFLAMQSRFQRGLIIFEEHLVPAFEGEILSFTGDEKTDQHDDFVDALVMAFHACNAASVDQPGVGASDRVATAGVIIVEDDLGFGTVRVIPRRGG